MWEETWARELYGFEIEPEVREWLDDLSDSDFKQVDEVAGLLAEKGTELGGPWSDHREGPVWELRVRLRDGAAFSRRSRFSSADSSAVRPGRLPSSACAWRTRVRSVSAVPIPSLVATALIVAHSVG
ncbi:hypothetical protein GCM10010517_17140 [Streptosporangium fragile]|uniref:Uncharacterized protein n=1 Tax=Streptosporangium fragile TaxID=46186 RepID=A0ABN3VW04_9ACTN